MINARKGGRFRCSAVGTDCDHVIRGDDHSLTNLEWLCARHHSIKTAAEGAEAKAAKRASGRRKPEQHPSEIFKRRRS